MNKDTSDDYDRGFMVPILGGIGGVMLGSIVCGGIGAVIGGFIGCVSALVIFACLTKKA